MDQQNWRQRKSQRTDGRSGYRSGYRISVETMVEESRDLYGLVFQNLKDRGLATPKLIISDDHSGLVSGDSGVLPRSLPAALQGAFHAEYPGLCTTEREEILCLHAEENLVNSHCGTSQKAGL